MRCKAIQGCDDLVSTLLHKCGAKSDLTIFLAAGEHILFMRVLGLIDMYFLVIL